MVARVLVAQLGYRRSILAAENPGLLSEPPMCSRRNQPDFDAACRIERARLRLVIGNDSCRATGWVGFVRRDVTGRNAGDSRQPANSLQRPLPHHQRLWRSGADR